MARWSPTSSLLLLLLDLTASLSLLEDVPLGTLVDVPHNQTVSIGSVARFTCRATVEPGWRIKVADSGVFASYREFAGIFNDKGILVDDSVSEPLSSTLLVDATEENNGTTVQCTAIAADLTGSQSDEVTLLIFGPPSTPGSLQVSSSQPQRLHVAWAPVPALPGEAVLYRVEITNLRTNTPLSRDLSTSSFVYSPNNIDGGSGTTCDVYKFRVKAINAAGSSEYGGSVRKALPQLPALGELRAAVLLSKGEVSAKVMFEAASTCPSYPVIECNVSLSNSSGDIVAVLEPLSPEETEISLTTAEGLRENNHYVVHVAVSNDIGRATSEMNLYTTDVQSASSRVVRNTVLVTCTFAAGSRAKGCLARARFDWLMATQKASIAVTEVSIARSPSGTNASGELEIDFADPACYTVLACDWEEDGGTSDVCVPAYQPPQELTEHCHQLAIDFMEPDRVSSGEATLAYLWRTCFVAMLATALCLRLL